MEKAIPILSPALQAELILHVNQPWIDRAWFLRGLEPACLVRLARELSARVFAPGELAPLGSLYVVRRGHLFFGPYLLTRGMVWGDDVILSSSRYALPYPARAVSFVDVLMVERETLAQVLCLFPASAARLRKTAVRLAFRRHLVAEAKRELDQQASPDSPPSHRAAAFLRADTITNFGAQCGQGPSTSQPGRASMVSPLKFLETSQKELMQHGCTRESLKRVLKQKPAVREEKERKEKQIHSSAVELAGAWRRGGANAEDGKQAAAHAQLMAKLEHIALSASSQGSGSRRRSRGDAERAGGAEEGASAEPSLHSLMAMLTRLTDEQHQTLARLDGLKDEMNELRREVRAGKGAGTDST